MVGGVRERRRTIRESVTHLCVLGTVVLLLIIIVYFFIDAQVSRDYNIVDSQQLITPNYKDRFGEIVDESGIGVTGIPTYDDAGVAYGKRIDITPEEGDFINIKSSYDLKTRTSTKFNDFSWSSSAESFFVWYSPSMYKASTLYEGSGIVKLYDRYVWTAIGGYWKEAFGLSEYSGHTFRVFMDNGKYYDIITCDAKGSDAAIKAPSGATIGHLLSNYSICPTEFEVVDFTKNYPTRQAVDGKPSMNYPEMFGAIKQDESHMKHKSVGFQDIEEFKGNVIAFQIITDPKVEEVVKQAKAEAQALRNK